MVILCHFYIGVHEQIQCNKNNYAVTFNYLLYIVLDLALLVNNDMYLSLLEHDISFFFCG